MAVNDLLELPTDRPIIADIFAAHVFGLYELAIPNRLLILVPTDEFQRDTMLGRSTKKNVTVKTPSEVKSCSMTMSEMSVKDLECP